MLRLLLEPCRGVTTDTIADFVWGDEQPKSASNSIARFIADLRTALGPARDRIETVPNGYRVIVRDAELDIPTVHDALATYAELGDSDPHACAVALTGALDLVGDDHNPVLVNALDGHHYLKIHDELRLDIVTAFVNLQLRRERYEGLTALLESVLTRRPLHEELWAALMTTLQRIGRPTDALRAARRARAALAEAGMDVGPRIAQIANDIAEATESDDLPSTPTVTYDGIAMAQNRLIGRSDDLDQLSTWVQQHRVVSIVGLGGAGKTRMGLQMAQNAAETGESVHVIGLQHVTDDELVASTIATALGVPASTTELGAATLAHALRGQSFFLLLDNCEHLIDSCRDIVDEVTRSAPDATVLMTSRVPIGATDEHVFHLGMLASSGEPTASTPAAALFIERSAPFRDARLTEGDLADINAISTLLGGHPLAIEVAAGQLADHTIESLLLRLTELRASASVGVSDTIDTLDVMLDWSWSRLSPSRQMLLSRLATFRGGCTFDAIHAVCGETVTVADDLAALVELGVITPTRDDGDGTIRYVMPEPIHGFALDRLVERSEVGIFEDRLARWMIDVSERWSIADSHVWAEASVQLLAERHNLTIALRRLKSSERKEELAWLAVRSSGMWINHGFAQEVVRWLAPLLADNDCSDSARSAAAAMVLSASHALGRLDDLTPLAMQSIEFADGQPLDWIPAVAAFMGMWSALSPSPMTSDEFDTLARTVADRSESPVANRALAELYPAHLDFNLRRYEAAASKFNAVLDLADRPGRLRLVAEAGYGLALLMAGHREQALTAMHQWTSEADTDEWHYIIDLFRALILAGAGDAELATVELAARVRELRPAAVWGRSDEIRSTFGVLAGRRGESMLSEELLSTVVVRDVLLLGVIAEHLATQRGTADDVGWFAVLQELWTRVLPDESDDIPTSARRALDFWTSGKR